MSQPLNIAVVGLGRMGKRHVHTILYRVPHARVVAVCSTMPHEIEWAKQNPEYQEFGITAYSDYNEMLNHPGLQAVWVSTSTDVHASQSLAAISKGLHVLCEKPLSTNMAEAQTVVDAAKKNPQLKVMAGFSRRFDASYRDAVDKKENALYHAILRQKNPPRT
ncbi:myo-inositol 2-dehydrogenase [Fusarium albosuccineum]|uniref:Myo-inositol 2-dehydrogenase n=1 Tax=Fusarium albosuccineum TaxID=1237068 RepID=A0A8H4KZN9_9HYPO|nr:myo-inositol 2-dehydrogenase [Fusarium albosuccineum]